MFVPIVYISYDHLFHTGQWNCDTPSSTHWRRLCELLSKLGTFNQRVKILKVFIENSILLMSVNATTTLAFPQLRIACCTTRHFALKPWHTSSAVNSHAMSHRFMHCNGCAGPVLENITQISADTQWCCGTYVDHVVAGL